MNNIANLFISELKNEIKFGQAKTNIAARNEAKRVKAEKKKLEDEVNNKSGDEIHYTDNRKYAAEYYGQTYTETTKYDNDWGDY
jgi:hypothetical protein